MISKFAADLKLYVKSNRHAVEIQCFAYNKKTCN